MTSIIIRKKDVDRLGKELLKEVFDFLHDEYILTNFEEMKKVQKNSKIILFLIILKLYINNLK